MSRLRYFTGAVVLLLLLISCTSSGPATSYYSLFPDKSISSLGHGGKNVSVGIGPVILPEYLENPAIVSLSRTQQVRVSGYHAWAGDLKSAMARVIAQNTSAALNADRVWAFPWDNRVRPTYQVRLVFEEFSGVRGGTIYLSAKWSVLNQRGDTMVFAGQTKASAVSSDDSVDSYVNALNSLLGQLSIEISHKLAELD